MMHVACARHEAYTPSSACQAPLHSSLFLLLLLLPFSLSPSLFPQEVDDTAGLGDEAPLRRGPLKTPFVVSQTITKEEDAPLSGRSRGEDDDGCGKGGSDDCGRPRDDRRKNRESSGSSHLVCVCVFLCRVCFPPCRFLLCVFSVCFCALLLVCVLRHLILPFAVVCLSFFVLPAD